MVNKVIDQKNIIKKFGKLFAIYGVQIWLILFVSNIGFITFIRFKASAQSCMSQSQINSDSRCLYVLSGSIYQIGSRNKPHKSHTCGIDVTSIIPSFHTSSASRYLLPNYVGPLCTNSSTPTPVPTTPPTQRPTSVPTAVPTHAPTQPPTNAPTAAPTSVPTARPTAIPTQNPSATKSPSPVPTLVPTHSPSPKPTSTNIAVNQTSSPTQAPDPIASPYDNSGFMRLLSYIDASPTPNQNIPLTKEEETAPEPIYTPNPEPVGSYYLYYWSTVFSYVSFVILLGVGVYWLIQKIYGSSLFTPGILSKSRSKE